MKRLYPSLISYLLSPASLWACSVCFGEAGGNLAKGFTWGILVLLLLPLILFGTIAFKVVMAVRRKNGNPGLASTFLKTSAPSV